MQPKSTANHSQFRAAVVSPRHQMVVRWADVIADTREAVEAQLARLRDAAAFDGHTVVALEYMSPKPIDPLPDDAGGPRTFGVLVRGESLAHWGIHNDDVVLIDPDQDVRTSDLALIRILGADGRERSMHLCDIDSVDQLVGSMTSDDVMHFVGPATRVLPARGFKPKRQRRSHTRPTIEQPTTDWTADLWPSVRNQLADLLADN